MPETAGATQSPPSPEPEAPDALEQVEAGLDALEATTEHETSRLAAVLRAAYPPILAIVLIVAMWQVLYAAKIWPDWKLPGPSEVFTSLKDTFSSGDAWPSVGHSVEHGAIGFGASVAIGTPLGLLVGASSRCGPVSGRSCPACSRCRRWPGYRRR